MGGGEVSRGIGELCATCFPRGAHIARLWARHLVSWPDDSSSQEEEEEDEQEEHEEVDEQREAGPKLPSGSTELEQGETEQEAEPHGQWRSWEWGSIMEEEECLAFDDPRLGFQHHSWWPLPGMFDPAGAGVTEGDGG